ncbi:MAG: hypothetical protein GY754_25070 [bacterium]|nr:hypothetical protein [bacterium]
MIKYTIDRFFSWMTFEPVIGLMMIIGAIVIFLMRYKKDGDVSPATFWEWARRILESAGVALLFLGLLWSFRAILNNNNTDFRQEHGRVSSVNYESVKRIWGSPHVQRELAINHTIEKTVKEELPRTDPSKPPLYKLVKQTYEVEQNSILSSWGKIKLTLNKRKKGSAYYNGFNSSFKMEYSVVNDSSYTTEAAFHFPLSTQQMLYENFKILENGSDISADLRFSSSGIRWSRDMTPGEKQKIEVSYTSRGLEYFYYQVPTPREIKNFKLIMEVENLPLSEVNYPEGCLTPKELKATASGNGAVLEWSLNRAITTAGMGIALPKPEQPGAKVALVLRNSPYALMLLIVSICLTFLIQGGTINFLEISLLSAVYCLLFIAMASMSDFLMGFWGSLILGALLTLGLSFLLYRNHPSALTKKIIFSLVGFFSLVYPLSGLFPDFQESFNGIVIMGLIIYLFWISLYTRLTNKDSSQ